MSNRASKDVALSLRELADKLPKQPVHLGLLQQALRGGAADIEQLRADRDSWKARISHLTEVEQNNGRLTAIVRGLMGPTKRAGYDCPHCHAQIVFGDSICPATKEQHAAPTPVETSAYPLRDHIRRITDHVNKTGLALLSRDWQQVLSELRAVEPTPRTVLETDTAPGGWAAPLDTGGTVELRTCEFCGCKTNARLRRCCNKGYEVDRAPVKASAPHVHEWHQLPRDVNFCVTCGAIEDK